MLYAKNPLHWHFSNLTCMHWTRVRSGSGITLQSCTHAKARYGGGHTLLNTRHGRSNTRSVMQTMPGHLEGWRQMQLRHCAVVWWTDTNSDTRLSCPTVTQKHINIGAL